MSDSLLFYHRRDNKLQIIDPDCLQHYDEEDEPLTTIVVEIIRAGYRGVIADEIRLSNGRVAHCINAINTLPEGRILSELCTANAQGQPFPPYEDVLARIREEYVKHGANQ